jgi:hypothetical protein
VRVPFSNEVRSVTRQAGPRNGLLLGAAASYSSGRSRRSIFAAAHRPASRSALATASSTRATSVESVAPRSSCARVTASQIAEVRTPSGPA